MEKKEQLALTLLICIILILECITAFSLEKLKEHVEEHIERIEEHEERQLEVNEYILNRIGG